MKGTTIATLAAVLMAGAAWHAQAQESGASLPLQFNVGPLGFPCGVVTYPTQCRNVPIVAETAQGTEYGQLWYIVRSPTDPSGNGWIEFLYTFAHLGNALVTSGSKYGPITFQGVTTDTNTPYIGTIELNTRTYFQCGGVKVRTCNWYWVITGGTITVTYQ
jgi:hypothetical protein